MGFLGIIRIAVAYKLVSILGTELHRYVKRRIYTNNVKNNSMNRWEYYLENKLLKNYSQFLESFGEIKLVPDFNVSGSISDVPNKCNIKVYDLDNIHIATIQCQNKAVIKKQFNTHYIDVEIAKFKVTPKDDKVEKRSRNIMAQTNKSNSITATEDTSIIKRISNIIKNS
tara:strand:- start:1077 stop:1586 length:510 start_codon:yes stop_codon:yes gene_type:complete